MRNALRYWVSRSRTGDIVGGFIAGAILVGSDSHVVRLLVCLGLIIAIGTAVTLDVLDPRETP